MFPAIMPRRGIEALSCKSSSVWLPNSFGELNVGGLQKVIEKDRLGRAQRQRRP